MTDEQLMQSFGEGDYEAFEVLYQKHKGGVYRYLLRQTASKSVAEDLFQDVWSQVIAGAANYKVTAKFTTWLYTIARNKLIDGVKHNKVVEKVLDTDCDTRENEDKLADDAKERHRPDIAYEQERQMVAIKHCVGRLPSTQLECFLLREEAGLALADIAEMVGSGLEAAKSRLRYAYKNLRECLENKLGSQRVRQPAASCGR
ncbi:sigma-70 family RNA polymerase sigma factor [Alteromonadaceae bacterium M269]|nr:sigma-70 family RNA polymerase sigma factor [Alteromonadaceae bacterium M269]